MMLCLPKEMFTGSESDFEPDIFDPRIEIFPGITTSA
jgi:hypothetical protein